MARFGPLDDRVVGRLQQALDRSRSVVVQLRAIPLVSSSHLEVRIDYTVIKTKPHMFRMLLLVGGLCVLSPIYARLAKTHEWSFEFRERDNLVEFSLTDVVKVAHANAMLNTTSARAVASLPRHVTLPD